MTLPSDIPSEEGDKIDAVQNEPLQIGKIVFPLYQSLFWIRLFSACLIVYGALITVTGIGVLVAWIPMWVGILLLLMAKTISQAYHHNDEQAFKLSLDRLKLIFTVLGLTSVGLIVATIYFLKYAIDKSLF